jgi:hypothetical protein
MTAAILTPEGWAQLEAAERDACGCHCPTCAAVVKMRADGDRDARARLVRDLTSIMREYVATSVRCPHCQGDGLVPFGPDVTLRAACFFCRGRGRVTP